MALVSNILLIFFCNLSNLPSYVIESVQMSLVDLVHLQDIVEGYIRIVELGVFSNARSLASSASTFSSIALASPPPLLQFHLESVSTTSTSTDEALRPLFFSSV